MGIALGLGAALAWGLADYVAALASRRAGVLPVVFGFHALATLFLAALVLGTGAFRELETALLPFFVLMGGVGWLSYVAFYRSLAIGPISVVSPIVSGYAAVTVVLAVVISGERLSPGELIAVVLAFGGVVLASADPREIASERALPSGIAFALAALFLFGVFVFGVAYYRERLGWLAPIFAARGFATLFLLGHVATARKLWIPDATPRLLTAIGALALLDTAGYVSFNLGTGHADTSVVATASAPYAVVPVVLGVLLLAERPAAIQWAGTALVVAGLVLLGVTA